DTFIASAAANALDGGAGSNTVHYGASTAGVIVNLSSVTQGGVNAMSGSGGYADGDTYANIQNVTGSSGNDVFYGGSVANVFNGNGGRDRVSYAADTADLIINFSAASVTVGSTTVAAGRGAGGNALNDTYTAIQDATGGSGNDTFAASASANAFDGGGGNNTVTYINSAAGVRVNLSDEVVNTVAARSGKDSHAEGDSYTNIQNVIGSGSADTLIGASSGATVLTGGAGSDTLIGIAANSSNTYASYAGSTAGVTINLMAGTATGGHAQGDTLSNIDNLIGSSFDDIFIGNGKVNIFNGGAAGNNTVSYAASSSAVRADLNGTTNSFGDATGDTYINIQNLTGSDYDDVLIGLAAGGSILTGGMGADQMTGYGLNNTINYAGSALGVVADLHNGNGIGSVVGSESYGDTFTGIQNVIGSTSNDLFYASSQANIFRGNGGVDTVNYTHSTSGVTVNLSATTIGGVAGGSGSGGFATGDTYVAISNVVGSNFNDTFIASDVANAFDGGAGNNTVSYAASATGVTVNLSGTTVSGVAAGTGANGYAASDSYANIQNVTGGAGNDTFIASDVANIFDGGAGNNTVSYYAMTGNVSASLASGTGGTGGVDVDTYANIQNLTGSALNGGNVLGSNEYHNLLIGNTGSNILTASGSNTVNRLEGGGGNDVLDGILGGQNTLIGGSGNDTFKITANTNGSNVTSSNAVSIVGNGGSDTLEVHGTGTTLNVSAFSNIVTYGSISTLDLSQGSWSLIKFSFADISSGSSGIGYTGVNNNPYLNITLKNGQGFQIESSAGSDSFAYFSGASEYRFYDNGTEVGRIHLNNIA
uniref:beta strand repeat-containing protein n=1 Tax=uncultured Oxalicibacterium sp. TaxID=1168540 RepID=UPI0025E83871